MCESAAAGQDPGSERGDAAGGLRAVPGQDGRGDHAGMNCIKIGLPGKLIFSKRKGLREVYSLETSLRK